MNMREAEMGMAYFNELSAAGTEGNHKEYDWTVSHQAGI